MSLKLITVAIATFRSAKLLPKVLDSVFAQGFDSSELEVWLIDGGSDDETISIGQKYGCKIVKNPRTEPVYAKFLAHKDAPSKYICVLDHDEVLESSTSLKDKIAECERNKDVRAAISSGYVNPPGYPWISQYINEFGDPFSRFYYNLSKDSRFFINSMRGKYRVASEDSKSVVFEFNNSDFLPLIELVAAGSLYDAEYVRKEFPETCKDPSLLPHFFYLMLSKQSKLAILKNDRLLHYSSDSLSGYLKKLRWRINNNIHFASTMGAAGFGGRSSFGSSSIRKYLFIPFSLSILPCFLDALYLCLSRKDIRYLHHVWLTGYTGLQIIYQYSRKLLGYRPQLKSYDESKVINVEPPVR